MNQEQALDPIETLDRDLRTALGATPATIDEAYMRAYVPQPNHGFLHILRTQDSEAQGAALPPAWRPV